MKILCWLPLLALFLLVQSLTLGFQPSGILISPSGVRCTRPRALCTLTARVGSTGPDGRISQEEFDRLFGQRNRRDSTRVLVAPLRKACARLWYNFIQQFLCRILGRDRWNQVQRFFRSITERYTIYVLECKRGKYYVGSTQNKKQRFYQHMVQGRGSVWTQRYKPIRVLKQYRRVPKAYALGLESKVTAQVMWKYGVNNARGAMFCNIQPYTLRDLDSLTRFIGHYNNLSYRDVREKLREELPPPIRRINNSTSPAAGGNDNNNSSSSVLPPPDTMGKQLIAKKRTTQQVVNGEAIAFPVGKGEKMMWNVQEFDMTPRQNGMQKRGPQANDRCYKCGRRGHWASNCPF